MKNWKILKQYSPDIDIVSTLLENRGLCDPSSQKEFILGKSLADYLKELPADFKDTLTLSKKIISQEMGANHPIVIYGDYDADGVCATAILYTTLKNELGYNNVTFFIPNRFDHGYGLSKGAIDLVLATLSTDLPVLFITVDTGVTASQEIVYIKSLGHQIIITDHHQKPQEAPQPTCLLWTDKVVGSAISFILARVLGSKNADNLAYAALATITDLVPLFGINRALVIEGLKILNTKPPASLKKLLEFSGKKDQRFTVYDLGWIIGPVLNASGRVVDATDSLQLLLATDAQNISETAAKLTSVNVKRQGKTLEMYDIAAAFDASNLPKIIVSEDTKYHEGIIGLVAGRLVQKYYRPSIVISVGEEFSKGSVRSVAGVDIIAFLRQFENLFINLGGHPMAAGFTIKTLDLPILKAKILELSAKITEELLVPTLIIDTELPFNIISPEFIRTILTLEPYGIGNKEPIFATKKVGIAAANPVGKEGQHMSFKFFVDGIYQKGILFNADPVFKNLKLGDIVDIAYTLSLNDFNQIISPSLVLKDILI